jgi:imidazolonepropionase-like amidohydrolase
VFRPKNWESIDFVDEAKIRKLAEATAQSRTWTCPTLTIFRKAFAEGQSIDEIRARPDWQNQPLKHRELYLQANERYWKNPPSEARRKKYVELRNKMLKAIADAGGRIMAGSDTPEWFFGYGYTLHRELESFVLAGLTPYQALAAATCNPAEFLHASNEWGTISVGKRADLVLLTANPLEDIRNTTKIDAVCIGGMWLVKDKLKEMIRVGSRAE